jgi:hypothetical protein
MGAHMGRVCVCVFIGVSAHMYMSIYIYTVFLKKETTLGSHIVKITMSEKGLNQAPSSLTFN